MFIIPLYTIYLYSALYLFYCLLFHFLEFIILFIYKNIFFKSNIIFLSYFFNAWEEHEENEKTFEVLALSQNNT